MSDHWPWENFTPEELICRCCGRVEMNPLFMDILQTIRGAYGKPMIITSGYRCPDHNDRVSGTGRHGPHTTGKAVDVQVSGPDAHRLLAIVGRYQSAITGVGISQKGPHGSRFIHLDSIKNDVRPWVWSY